ncbi:hypothetical protein UFOVP1608_12 [uncultured Caudovirales phage]|uniref:Uncharacterized protein n=1 Tax=uncultured Caudovirales phage TaxID=2100421 RepID=A0A6J5SRR8_9CAUD|nr:hypothetical protein UFOVP1608_12 [uncultured Caudovirales phage]
MAAITLTKSFPAIDTLVDVTNEDTSTNGTAFLGYELESVIEVRLDVTAVSGAPDTLDVTIEDSPDGVTWSTLETFTQVTTVSSEIKRITAAHDDYIRAKWLIGGISASFDFTVKAFTLGDNLATETAADATGDATGVTGYGALTPLIAYLDVTAATGTLPTLDVLIEDSADGVTWATLGTFTQKVATGTQTIVITDAHDDHVRASWTIGGTLPSFDFTVDLYTVADTLASQVGEDESTNTTAVTGYSGADFAIAQLDVTAASGTNKTLDVKLQHSIDGTTWLDVSGAGFTQKTATGTQIIVLENCVWGDYIRVNYLLGGTTPSFDFTVKLFAK